MVYATDLQGKGSAPLAVASRLALEHAATLHIVHVQPLKTSSGLGMLHEAIDIHGGGAQDKLRALVPPDPSVPFVHRLEVGEPEARIIEVVEQERADFLVVEERSRFWWRRAVHRSLCERLLLRAPCPVVVCRADDSASTGPLKRRGVAPERPLEVLDLLTGLLTPRVDALLTWMDHLQDTVLRVAQGPGVRQGLGAIVRGGGGALSMSRLRRQLALELCEFQGAMRAVGVNLSAQGAPIYAQGIDAKDGPARTAFVKKVREEGAALSLPLDADDGLIGGLVILAGARIDLPGIEDASLTFAVDARTDFLRILAQPGPMPSVETYAFDHDGLMLSNSRFPADLRRLGLLPPEDGLQTPRRLHIREPARSSSDVPADGRAPPLTLMAREATEGRDGSDWRGYDDYRGIKVVGAWRWIPRYGFGVAAEMDRPPSWPGEG